MILVFYASLAPRGYGRTSPRSPRVYLPFVANLAQLAAFCHHKPTRMPKMILVFHASLAPRDYGRTSPRSPRVNLHFVALVGGLVAVGHQSRTPSPTYCN